MHVRYRLLDSIRAFALEAMTDAGLTDRALGRARRDGSPTPPQLSTEGVRSHRQARVSRRSLAPSAPTSTPRWRGARRTTRCSRSTSSTASAGRGSSSATAEARNGSWPRSTRPATPRRSPTGPTRCCSRRGSKRRPVDSNSRATTSRPPTDLADAIDDVDLQARCCYYLAYVVSHHGEFGHAMELTDRSRRALRRARPAVGPGRELALRRPSRDLGRRRGAQRRRSRSGASTGWQRSTTRGSMSAARRCSASWLASSTGSTTPSSTSVAPRRRRDSSASCRPRRTRSRVSDERSARPATTTPALPRWSSRSRRPKPPATFAWRRSRACTSGESSARSDATTQARTALEARDRVASCRRAVESRPRSASACSRRIDAEDGRRRAPRLDSPTILDDAQRNDDAHVEVFALDALGSHRGRRRRHRHREDRFVQTLTDAWTPRRTSSPSATESTPMRSRQIA